MLAEYSPGDYQQRIRRFKIKRPFNLKIDIDQKECSSIKGNWPALGGSDLAPAMRGTQLDAPLYAFERTCAAEK
jgi:hypothetical protein